MAHPLLRALLTPADPDDPEAADPALIAALLPLADQLTRWWYRLQVEGIENLPDGPALVVGNHNAGVMFLEAFGFGAQVMRARPDREQWRGLGHDAVVDAPLVGRLLVRLGVVRASPDNAQRAFDTGRKVVVFPGGNAEAFRAWRRRHEVDLQGRHGFLRLALRAGVPIVPVVFIGGHDGLIVLREGRRLARLLRADRVLRSDAWPVMLALPWGVAVGPLPHLPLPVPCTTRILPPISLDGYTAEDADNTEALADLYAQVQGAMQAAMDDLAAARPSLRARLRARLG